MLIDFFQILYLFSLLRIDWPNIVSGIGEVNGVLCCVLYARLAPVVQGGSIFNLNFEGVFRVSCSVRVCLVVLLLGLLAVGCCGRRGPANP